jgi:hypothetical protein
MNNTNKNCRYTSFARVISEPVIKDLASVHFRNKFGIAELLIKSSALPLTSTQKTLFIIKKFTVQMIYLSI